MSKIAAIGILIVAAVVAALYYIFRVSKPAPVVAAIPKTEEIETRLDSLKNDPQEFIYRDMSDMETFPTLVSPTVQAGGSQNNMSLPSFSGQATIATAKGIEPAPGSAIDWSGLDIGDYYVNPYSGVKVYYTGKNVMGEQLWTQQGDSLSEMTATERNALVAQGYKPGNNPTAVFTQSIKSAQDLVNSWTGFSKMFVGTPYSADKFALYEGGN